MVPHLIITVFLFGFAKMEIEKRNRTSCEFPSYLQTTESKPWILNHTSSIVTYYVEGDQITIYDCSKSTHKCSSYRRECWKIVLGDRFLVRHVESVYTDRFLCLRFEQRSKSIVQIRTSHIKTGSTNEYLCRDKWLSLDPWPWISHKHYAYDEVQCPFSGGYNFEMYFNGGYMSKNQRCTDVIPPVRLESGCTEGEGMTFRFRNRNCLHEEGNFDLFQKTSCIATWEENGDSFAILRKSNDRYFWCIRVVTSPRGDIDKIFVFLDWQCEHGHIDPNNVRYIQLDKIGKPNQSDTCSDEFYACETLGDFCASDVKDVCPRTCGQCNDTLKYCTFPQSIQGTWVKSTLDGNEQITIDNSTLMYPQIGKFHCVTFDSELIPLRRVLLQEFSNGCYPRFTCLQYDTPSPAVLRFRVGSVLMWPIVLSDLQICDNSKFQKLVDTPRPGEKMSYTFPLESVVLNTTAVNYVTCNLPSFISRVSSFRDDRGQTGCIVHGTFSTPRSIYLSYLRHGDVIDSVTYKCVASLTYISSPKSIIISREGSRGDRQYICWIILDKTQIIQVPAASCNKLTANSIKQGIDNFSKLLMRRFFLQSESSYCVSDNKTMAYLAQAWTVPPPFSKQISSSSPPIPVDQILLTYLINIVILTCINI